MATTRRPVRLITPMRSDGVLVYRGANNGPTQEQLTKTKVNGVFNWYQDIEVHESTHLDWRRKLGGLYASELHRKLKAAGNLPADGPLSGQTVNPEEFVLVDFPENFRLFEHRRATSLETTGVKSASDRRDVYLYGHPQGNRKRFRSPADFFPHLWWLMTTDSENHEDCACKLCTTEEYLKIAQKVKELQDGQNGIVTVSAANGDTKSSAAPSKPTAAVPKSQISHQPQPQRAVASAPSAPTPPTPSVILQQPMPSVIRAPPQPTPAPTVTAIQKPAPPIKPRNPDQQLDQQVNKFLYRVGELVWFTNAEESLSLVAVIARHLHRVGDVDQPTYMVQPISHPFEYLDANIESNEKRITPFLAYSTPQCQRSGPPEIHYEQVPWAELRSRHSLAELIYDGSIKAAAMVDSTYTLFKPLGNSGPNGSEVDYNGVYLGSEFVWAGEAVRLQATTETQDILIINRIIEKKVDSGNQTIGVDFVGDVYSSAEATHKPERPMPPNQYLPVRVREDLKQRNEVQNRILGRTTYWKLIEAQKRVSISMVKGRWYEAWRILPTVNPQAWEEGRKSGRIPDGAERFNTRNPVQNGEIGVSVSDRRQAFSRSIPPNVTFPTPFPSGPLKPGPQQLQPSPAGHGPMSSYENMDTMSGAGNFMG